MVAPAAVPVTFVTGTASLGGAERYLEMLLLELGEGWVREVISLTDGPWIQRLRNLDIPVQVMPAATGRRGLVRSAASLRRVLTARRPQVVHANDIRAAVAGSLARGGLGVPVLWVKHDLAHDGPLAWTIAAGCSRVIGVSATVLDTFPPPLRGRTAVIYPGIPPVTADRGAARRLVLQLTGFTAEAEIVVVSGRICPGKGQMELIEAAPRILASRPAVRFVVLGSEDPFYPGHEAQVRQRARALGVAEAFAFVGQRPADDAIRLVAGCDVLAAPSVRDAVRGWEEGFGLAVVEALHVGTPVVAYDSGALAEVLDGSGRLVLEGNRLALADAISSLLGDPDERARLALRGECRAKQRFSIARAALEIAHHYTDLATR